MFFSLLIFISGLAASNDQKIVLTSDVHSNLFFSTWHFNTTFYNHGVFLIIDGYTKNNEGLCIYRWTDHAFEKLITTTPREGFFSARTVVVNPDGNEIYLTGWIQEIVYKYTPGGDFKRFAAKEQSQAFVYYNRQLIRGNKGLFNNLELVPDGDSPVLTKINANLPQDATHVSETKSNDNEMCLGLGGSALAVGYTLYNKVKTFDLKTGETIAVIEIKKPFSGYNPPPETYYVESTGPQGSRPDSKWFEWLSTFNRLKRLAWHKGGLYGFFFRDAEGRGIWARLDGGDESKPFVWDNDANEIQILAIGPDRVILGRVEEDANEAVTWTLWQSGSLPSL